MNEVLFPDTVESLEQMVQSASSVLPVGNQTKTALSAHPDATLVSTARLRGITEYEPSEFTFTAWAGTPIAEVSAALAEQNQYLPFDPLLSDAGATLGGTVAAGISGPGRVRYGGLRDFLLGVRLLSGSGCAVNVGGKVVKNAAGFDIPKLLVGALGRFGVMTELTFKVFPTAMSLQTYQFPCRNDREAMDRIAMAAASRWELDAIDYRVDCQTLYLRIGGPEPANQAIAAEIGQQLDEKLQLVPDDAAAEFWGGIRELNWSGGEKFTVKIPITPSSFMKLRQQTGNDAGFNLHLSAAGNLLWAAVDSVELLTKLDEILAAADLSGLVITGSSNKLWLGRREDSAMARAVKSAMDPAGKFPDF